METKRVRPPVWGSTFGSQTTKRRSFCILFQSQRTKGYVQRPDNVVECVDIEKLPEPVDKETWHTTWEPRVRNDGDDDYDHIVVGCVNLGQTNEDNEEMMT